MRLGAGDAVTLRSLPVALRAPADRGGQSSGDQPVGERAIALIAVILEPGGMDGVGAEMLARRPCGAGRRSCAGAAMPRPRFL